MFIRTDSWSVRFKLRILFLVKRHFALLSPLVWAHIIAHRSILPVHSAPAKERRTKRRSCSGKRCIIVSQHCCPTDEQMSFTRRRFISHCVSICRTHRAGNGPTRWIRTHIRYRCREKSLRSFLSPFLSFFVWSFPLPPPAGQIDSTENNIAIILAVLYVNLKQKPDTFLCDWRET